MTSSRRDQRRHRDGTEAPQQVHLRIGRLVIDAGLDAATLDRPIRGALAQRLGSEPALRHLARPIADALAPQLATQAAARAAKG